MPVNCSWVFVVDSVKEVQDNLKHQRTEVSRLVALLGTIVLCVPGSVLLARVVGGAVIVQIAKGRLLVSESHIVVEHILNRNKWS